MNAVKDKITFAVNGETFGKFKLRDGDRKMKLYIKLNKDETSQWEALKQALTGGEMSNDTLARILFFKGIHAITAELNERVENMSDEEKEEIMKQMSAEQVDAAMNITTQLGVVGAIRFLHKLRCGKNRKDMRPFTL